jgi:hypothetical protein
MDASLIEDLVKANRPFRIETASGRTFGIPHGDYLRFTKKRTAVFIFFEEDGQDRFAIVPLLTVTAAIADDHPETASS